VHCLRIDQDGEQDLLWAMEFQTSQWFGLREILF
jgi:hypothetical protein